MHYDAIIIGAGPAGLAAAARLSHFGIKVCLLDAHSRPGGLNSWHHVNGREISSGLHAFTNHHGGSMKGPLAKLQKQLRLKSSDLALHPQRQSSIRFPGVTLTFSNDPELIRQQIATHFPDQTDRFDKFRNLIRETDEGEITEKQTSARDVMESFITNPLLADMLFCPVMYYGNPGGVGDGKTRTRPDMDWLLFCVMWKCIFETGLAHPADGIRPLWELLLKRIRENDGDVRLGTRAARLLHDGGGIVGAALDDGSVLTADLYFSSAGAEETRRLVDTAAETKEIPIGEISVVEGIRVLDSNAEALGIRDTAIFYSFDEKLEFRRPDGLFATASGVVCAPGNYEDVDDNVLKVSFLASYPQWRALTKDEYAAKKCETGEAMAAVLERLGFDLTPERGRAGRFGFFDDLFTPLTLERYTSHIEGALYGSPVKKRSGETAFRNLFLIGTDQGFHGIVGAMLSGVAMANEHCLAKRGK